MLDTNKIEQYLTKAIQRLQMLNDVNDDLDLQKALLTALTKNINDAYTEFQAELQAEGLA